MLRERLTDELEERLAGEGLAVAVVGDQERGLHAGGDLRCVGRAIASLVLDRKTSVVGGYQR